MLRTLLEIEFGLYLLFIDFMALLILLLHFGPPGLGDIGFFLGIPFFNLMLLIGILGLIILILFFIKIIKKEYIFNFKGEAIIVLNYVKKLINFKIHPFTALLCLLQLIIILLSIPAVILFIYLFIYNATYHG